jgi:hypothetical protein
MQVGKPLVQHLHTYPICEVRMQRYAATGCLIVVTTWPRPACRFSCRWGDSVTPLPVPSHPAVHQKQPAHAQAKLCSQTQRIRQPCASKGSKASVECKQQQLAQTPRSAHPQVLLTHATFD